MLEKLNLYIMIAYLIHLIFLIYTIMLIVRVIGSWFPSFMKSKIMQYITHYTDPYLNIFRKIIPPIGGVLDLSPMLGFFVLQLLETFLLRLFR